MDRVIETRSGHGQETFGLQKRSGGLEDLDGILGILHRLMEDHHIIWTSRCIGWGGALDHLDLHMLANPFYPLGVFLDSCDVEITPGSGCEEIAPGRSNLEQVRSRWAVFGAPGPVSV
jgi:hypothetical protein